MAGRGRAGRVVGAYEVDHRYEVGSQAAFDDPRNPRAWGIRGAGFYGGGRGPPLYRGERGSLDVVCFNCKQPGHTKSICPHGPPAGRFLGPSNRGLVLRDERDLEYWDRDVGIPPERRLNGAAFDGPPDRLYRSGDEYAGGAFEGGASFRGGAKGGCFSCGQFGHKARECPRKGDPPPPPSRREEELWRSPPPKGDSTGAPRRWCFKDLDGKLQGPYDLEQLHRWMQTGHFQIDQLVCLEGSSEMTTLARALGLPIRRESLPPPRAQEGAFQRREPPPSRAAERAPLPRESRFDKRPSYPAAEPSGPPPPSFSPAQPCFRPPPTAAQLPPPLQIPEVTSPQLVRPPFSVTPPPSVTPSVAATPSIASTISPNFPSSIIPQPQGFASLSPPGKHSPPLALQSPKYIPVPQLDKHSPSLLKPLASPLLDKPTEAPQADAEAWGNGALALKDEAQPSNLRWENGYDDGCSSLSESEPGSPLHFSPRAALGQQLLNELDPPIKKISDRVERILRDAEIDDETPVDQRMDVVIGILGRRLLDREGKEEKEMRSFAHGSHAEADSEVPVENAWKRGYGFGEMAAAEAREADSLTEINLDPDLFYHAYGPGNTGKGGQPFYHDEEAALGPPENDGVVVYELDAERQKQDPAKWLLRGGDWKLEHDPQLRLEDDTGNPPPLCKYVLNRGFPLCGEELPEVDPEKGEGPKDPRLKGTHRVAMQEAVRADFSKLEMPSFGHEGIPAKLQKEAGKGHPVRSLTHSPSPLIQSPSENVRPPVPAKRTLKKSAKVGVLKKTGSTSGLAKSDGTAVGSEPGGKPKEAGEKGQRAESPAAQANGLLRKSSQLAGVKTAQQDSPGLAPKKTRQSKWDEGEPEKGRAETPEGGGVKKLSLAQAVEAAKRAQLGPEDGQWFYLDGQGAPKGPHSLPQLRNMAARGEIMEGISAWRMVDDTWVPIAKQPLVPKESRFGPPPPGVFTPAPGVFTSAPHPSGFWPRPPPPWQRWGGLPALPLQPPLPPGPPPGLRVGGPLAPPSGNGVTKLAPGKGERSMPPQLLALVRGKLHEQVVKTARTKVLDAAIDAALSGWLQQKLGVGSAEEIEGSKRRGVEKEWAEAEPAVREGGSAQAAAEPPEAGRQPAADTDGLREPSSNEAEDPEAAKSLEKFLKSRRSIAYIFLDACKSPRGGMDMALLARFACVCKGFRKGAELAKLRMFKADFSVLGEKCTDAALKSLETCGEGLVKFVYLNGCINVTPEAVEDLLRAQPSIRCVDIQGCVQIYSLARSTPQIKWRNLPEALVEVPGAANALPPEQLEDQQKRREKWAKARQLKGIERILDEIRKLDSAKIFLVPVSEEQYPNYSKIIHRPIALVTMRQRLKGRYLPLGKGVDRFREDLALMFDNAKRFNREGTFYYKEAVRLSKVANKLLEHLEARVRGTLDGTIPVRKASHRRVERTALPPKPFDLDLGLQARLTKPSMPIKTPRGVGEADALPSISASSVEESFRAGVEEGRGDWETGRKRKERGEEREESESVKRRREDSDAESNRPRGKRPREDEESEEFRARRADSAKRLEAEGKRPVSATLHWEPNGKRRPARAVVPRTDLRGVWSEGGCWGLELEQPGTRKAAATAAKALRMLAEESEVEEWEEQELEEEQESDPESIGESEEEDDNSDEEAEDHRAWVMEDDLADRTNWGAKMTKATMVPPVSRKYELIDEYQIVSDTAVVQQKMRARLPDEILGEVALNGGKIGRVSQLDEVIVHPKEPRKKLGEEVLEQEVYGIDPYTHNLLLDTMPKNVKGYQKDEERHSFIEQPLLMALNRAASAYTGYAQVPESLDLKVVVQIVRKEAEEANNGKLVEFTEVLYHSMEKRPLDKYLAYRKGLGVVCNRAEISKDDFVVEFHGEVYPPYRWFEKEDEIRHLQKKDVAPEFYNIMLERPKMDLDGYDLLVVDAMHKANFASRLCHSCTPNCATKVTCVDGRYMIGLYAIEDIKPGDELTFNYHSVTESKEEHEHAVCLCGSRQCQGSYLNFAGSTGYQQVMNKRHGFLDRHHLLLRASQDPTLDQTDRDNLERAGFRDSLLAGLPAWVKKYAAQVVAFIFEERELLPDELLEHTKKHKRRNNKADDEVARQARHAANDEAEGVESQRLQNLAITLDKVRHCLAALCKCPATEAPPPLRLLSPAEVVSRIWTAEDSVVQQIRRFLELHVDDLARLTPILEELRARQPQETQEGLLAMRASLLWLRDTLIGLDIKPTARHDAAADLLTMYAYTKDFFTHADYVAGSFESEPVTIVAMDLGVKESRFQPTTVRKSYKPYFVWGQLINWYKQSVADPGAPLSNLRRGCLTLPDPGSCYSATAKQAIPRGYGRKQRARMLDKYIVNKVQGPWPKQEQHWLWSHNIRGLYGTPWFDAVREGRLVNPELLKWLRTRPVFEGPYDHNR